MEETRMIPVQSTELSGYRLVFQLRGVPVQFANAIRRVLLNETTTVEITDVQVLENTTLVPHEVLRHRVEMLPVNVHPSEEDVIRDARITLRLTADAPRNVLTSDFAIGSTRTDILMKDRDLDVPLFFLKLKKDESVHITARLALNPKSSQVCVATYGFHVDEEKAAIAAEGYADKNTFNVFHKQRSFHVSEQGRPDWFDFTIESIGVIRARDLLVNALGHIKMRTKAWADAGKETLIREAEPNAYTVVSTTEGHTIGALAQILAYESKLCKVVSYDVPHPLTPEMKFRFLTEKAPEEILDMIAAKVGELCDATISSLDK
jgi:DNA-directed RNA polymerase subunit L